MPCAVVGDRKCDRCRCGGGDLAGSGRVTTDKAMNADKAVGKSAPALCSSASSAMPAWDNYWSSNSSSMTSNSTVVT